MKRAFTLIELLVVIAIIAVLAAIVAPNAFRAIEKAKVTATVADVRSIRTGAMAFYADTGQWPASGTTTDMTPNGFLADPSTSAAPVRGWDGPYLEKWPPTAKWGGAYTFVSGVDETGVDNDETTLGGFNWDDTDATPNVRVVSITGVPGSAAALATTAAGKIDVEIDGAVDENAGSVRYALANPTIVFILVSRD